MALITEVCAWQGVDEALPDSDETVLIFYREANEPVWLGYHDGHGWVSVDGEPLGDKVTHWARMLEGPRV